MHKRNVIMHVLKEPLSQNAISAAIKKAIEYLESGMVYLDQRVTIMPADSESLFVHDVDEELTRVVVYGDKPLTNVNAIQDLQAVEPGAFAKLITEFFPLDSTIRPLFEDRIMLYLFKASPSSFLMTCAETLLKSKKDPIRDKVKHLLDKVIALYENPKIYVFKNPVDDIETTIACFNIIYELGYAHPLVPTYFVVPTARHSILVFGTKATNDVALNTFSMKYRRFNNSSIKIVEIRSNQFVSANPDMSMRDRKGLAQGAEIKFEEIENSKPTDTVDITWYLMTVATDIYGTSMTYAQPFHVNPSLFDADPNINPTFSPIHPSRSEMIASAVDKPKPISHIGSCVYGFPGPKMGPVPGVGFSPNGIGSRPC